MTTAIISKETPDTELSEVATALAPTLDGDTEQLGAAIFCLGLAFRTLLQNGHSPVQAVKTISSLAVFLSGVDYEGPFTKLNGG